MNENILVRFDWVIKNMLRDKSNYCILEGFLSALLKEDITVIEILESESNQEDDDNKFNRVDLLVQDSKKRKIIVEVQNNKESYFLERVLFATSKVITERLKLGESYKNIAKVISVSVLYFNLGSDSDYIYYGTNEIKGLHSKKPLKINTYLLNDNGKQKQQNKLNVFPEYYFITVNKFKDKVKDDIDEWVYMMKNSEIKSYFKSKNMKETKQKLAYLNLPLEERKKYEKYMNNMRYEKDVIETALEDLVKKFVKEMLLENENIDKIMKYSKLSIEEIEKIQKEL